MPRIGNIHFVIEDQIRRVLENDVLGSKIMFIAESLKKKREKKTCSNMVKREMD